MRDVVEAMRAWLPHPVYRFSGGPFDGQRLTVTLYETAGGMAAPEVWNLADPPSPPQPSAKPSTLAIDVVVQVHRYRFVHRPGSINEGHYEYMLS